MQMLHQATFNVRELQLTAGTDEYPYQEQETINLDLTLSQFGFPLDGIVVKVLALLSLTFK